MANEKMGDSQGGFSESEMKQGYRQIGTQPLKEKSGHVGNDGEHPRKEPVPDSEGGQDQNVKGE